MKTKYSFRFVLVILSLFLGLGQSLMAQKATTEITNTAGKTLKVKLTKLDGEKIQFLNLANRKPYTVPLSSLSEESQNYIKEWVKAGGGLSRDFRIDVSMITSNKKSKIENYDDRHVKMRPKAILTNKGMAERSVPLKATLIILGRPVLDKSSLVVISRQEKTVESLEPLGKKELVFSQFETFYDNKAYAQYGNRYSGRILILQSTINNEVVACDISPHSFPDKTPEELLKLRERRKYANNLSDL